MKFGVARHGPLAPSARQLGKYEVFTITGTPVRETSNSTLSFVVFACDTVTFGRDSSLVARALVCDACCQLEGPPSVSGRSSALGSLNHGTAVHSHALKSFRVVPAGGAASPSHFQ